MSTSRRRSLSTAEGYPLGKARSKTPSQSLANSDDGETITPKETPGNNLRRHADLVRKPSTPSGQASSMAPASLPRRTPGTGRRQQPGSAKRPTTPHAMRALQQRRAAAQTPARDRRRSARIVKHGTPRDILRNLSRVLAPVSQPTRPSPIEMEKRKQSTQKPRMPLVDDFEEEPDPPKPRLSLPIDRDEEDEDSSPDMRPPRLSLLLDEEPQRRQSIEVPRRAWMEKPFDPFRRESLGLGRQSGKFSDLEDPLTSDGFSGGTDRGFETLQDQDGEDLEDENTMGRDSVGYGGDTEDLRRVFLEESNRRQSRLTDLGIGDLSEIRDDSTFAFDAPLADDEQYFTQGMGSNIFQEDQAGHETEELAKSNLLNEQGQLGKRKRKEVKYSQYGIPYPSLPGPLVKKLAINFAKSSGIRKARMSKETSEAINRATDFFFRQVADDLETYSKHAGRRTIDESDVTALMRRQRQLGSGSTLFSLAQRHLPRELLQSVRMEPSSNLSLNRARRSEPVDESEEDGS
ncbi:MAG: hypothetical protein M1834_003457 [Cirrosporium novae-zelandiae]|nr:MAG: hypothetical protein M1834_003457 [Cirrosporium novae-zelandiae]